MVASVNTVMNNYGDVYNPGTGGSFAKAPPMLAPAYNAAPVTHLNPLDKLVTKDPSITTFSGLKNRNLQTYNNSSPGDQRHFSDCFTVDSQLLDRWEHVVPFFSRVLSGTFRQNPQCAAFMSMLMTYIIDSCNHTLTILNSFAFQDPSIHTIRNLALSIQSKLQNTTSQSLLIKHFKANPASLNFFCNVNRDLEKSLIDEVRCPVAAGTTLFPATPGLPFIPSSTGSGDITLFHNHLAGLNSALGSSTPLQPAPTAPYPPMYTSVVSPHTADDLVEAANKARQEAYDHTVGQTLLQRAIQNGNSDWVQRVLDNPASDNDISTVDHTTCFHSAVAQALRTGNTDILYVLAIHPSTQHLINTPDNFGRTPFMRALDTPLSIKVLQDHKDTVCQFLISALMTGNLSLQTNLSSTHESLLHVLAKSGCFGVAETLFNGPQFSIDALNAGNLQKKTPLYLACECRDSQMVTLFVDAGVDPNATDNQGETALHKAIHNGDSACVEALLQSQKIDLTKKTRHQQTPIKLLQDLRHKKTLSKSQKQTLFKLLNAEAKRQKKVVAQQKKAAKRQRNVA